MKQIVYDRERKMRYPESGYGELGLSFLYGSPLGRLFLKYFSSNAYANRKARKAATAISRKRIMPFVARYRINLSDFEARDYTSFLDFFTRRFAPGARVIDAGNGRLVAPADSRLTVFALGDQKSQGGLRQGDMDRVNLDRGELCQESMNHVNLGRWGLHQRDMKQANLSREALHQADINQANLSREALHQADALRIPIKKSRYTLAELLGQGHEIILSRPFANSEKADTQDLLFEGSHRLDPSTLPSGDLEQAESLAPFFWDLSPANLPTAISEHFKGGICLVFRLTVDDCHRYCFSDAGQLIGSYEVPGALHTVRPRGDAYRPFAENHRFINILHTASFGLVAQIEIGAMQVGRIFNHGQAYFRKGEEKGFFSLGGSTIVLLLEAGAVALDADILKQSAAGIETRVRYGEGIGDAANRSQGKVPDTDAGHPANLIGDVDRC